MCTQILRGSQLSLPYTTYHTWSKWKINENKLKQETDAHTEIWKQSRFYEGSRLGEKPAVCGGKDFWDKLVLSLEEQSITVAVTGIHTEHWTP